MRQYQKDERREFRCKLTHDFITDGLGFGPRYQTKDLMNKGALAVAQPRTYPPLTRLNRLRDRLLMGCLSRARVINGSNGP
jgi:hypothetical protein